MSNGGTPKLHKLEHKQSFIATSTNANTNGKIADENLSPQHHEDKLQPNKEDAESQSKVERTSTDWDLSPSSSPEAPTSTETTTNNPTRDDNLEVVQNVCPKPDFEEVRTFTVTKTVLPKNDDETKAGSNSDEQKSSNIILESNEIKGDSNQTPAHIPEILESDLKNEVLESKEEVSSQVSSQNNSPEEDDITEISRSNNEETNISSTQNPTTSELKPENPSTSSDLGVETSSPMELINENNLEAETGNPSTSELVTENALKTSVLGTESSPSTPSQFVKENSSASELGTETSSSTGENLSNVEEEMEPTSKSEVKSNGSPESESVGVSEKQDKESYTENSMANFSSKSDKADENSSDGVSVSDEQDKESYTENSMANFSSKSDDNSEENLSNGVGLSEEQGKESYTENSVVTFSSNPDYNAEENTSNIDEEKEPSSKSEVKSYAQLITPAGFSTASESVSDETTNGERDEDNELK